jgi:hypothetical protein
VFDIENRRPKILKAVILVIVFNVDAVAKPILGLPPNTCSPVLASSTVSDTEA